MAKGAYLVLARKYRPATFDEVVGQEPAVQTLRNAVESNHVGQAYLFAGPRGVGKTTMARLLAKSLNCLAAKDPTPTPCNKCEACTAIASGDDIDVLEIDGASNRKVEESRDLRETVQYAPVRGRYKVYIIDEVHMLTTEAFNTLLKTLEEPPEKVKFLFATTQPYKVPETILSRCQRLDFRRIPTALIADELTRIAKAEKLKADPAVLRVLARTAKGGMRDALSLLDLLLAQGKKKITVAEMNAVLGFIGEENRFAFSAGLRAGDLKEALGIFHAALEQGTDVGQFLDQVLDHFRSLLLVRSCGKDAPGLDELTETAEQLAEQAKDFTTDSLIYAIQILTETATRIRTSTQARALVELAIIKLSRLQEVQPMGELLARLTQLEQRLLGGAAGAVSERVSTPRPVYARQPAASAASRPPAQSQAAPPASGGVWDQLLHCLAQKRATLAHALEAGQMLRLEDSELVIGLPRSAAFHKSRAEQADNKALIESCARQVTGKACRVSIELVSSQPSDAAASEQAADELAESETVEEELPPPTDAPGHTQAAVAASRRDQRMQAEQQRAEQIRAHEEAIKQASKDPVIKQVIDSFQGTIIGLGD